MPRYIHLCPHCKKSVSWSQRDRLSYGWYCPHHNDKETHPKNFYGYLTGKLGYSSSVIKIEQPPIVRCKECKIEVGLRLAVAENFLIGEHQLFEVYCINPACKVNSLFPAEVTIDE